MFLVCHDTAFLFSTRVMTALALTCRLIYMLSILCVRLMIKVNVGILESFKVGWYPPKKLGRVTLKDPTNLLRISRRKRNLEICAHNIVEVAQFSKVSAYM